MNPISEIEVANLAYLAAHGPITPLSYKEAIRSPDPREWHQAMSEEIGNLTRQNTWELVPLPKGRKAIGSRWTYVIKFSPDGTITRYKAQLVAQGFSQVIGIDFNDTFAPMVRLETIQALLHLAIVHGWFQGQDDIMAAFLHGNLDEVIYMRQPEGFDDGTDCVT